VPRFAFDDFNQTRQEIRGQAAVGDAVIHGERELGHRSHMNVAVQGDNAVPLAAYGENG
jgi:hypothetical protein